MDWELIGMKFSAPFGSHKEIINRFNLLLTRNAKISNLERRIDPKCLKIHEDTFQFISLYLSYIILVLHLPLIFPCVTGYSSMFHQHHANIAT